jgi:hypothetical protein
MKITIQHNHGFITLRDAKLVPYDYTNQFGTHKCNRVEGIVEAGASTNRLFQATNTKHEPVGQFKSVEIWGRKPHQQADGTWFVDICTCG